METYDQIPDEMLHVSDATLNQGVNLLNALSNEDAVRIFLYADKGIANSTQAIKDLGLTQKRYYSRLKGLIEVGLIEKNEGTYRYTALGRIIHKLGLHLIGILDNQDQIKLLSSLSETKAISSSEIDEIFEILSDKPGELKGLLEPIIKGHIGSNAEHLDTFERLVKKVVEEVNTSKSSLLLATSYLDVRVMDTSLKAINRGVTMKCLFSKERLGSKLSAFKLMLSPKIMASLLAFLDSSIDLKDTLREVDLPFSFVIVDDHKCFFELPSISGEFAIAFYLASEDTAKRFIELFYKLWDLAQTSAWIGFFEKVKKL